MLGRTDGDGILETGLLERAHLHVVADVFQHARPDFLGFLPKQLKAVAVTRHGVVVMERRIGLLEDHTVHLKTIAQTLRTVLSREIVCLAGCSLAQILMTTQQGNAEEKQHYLFHTVCKSNTKDRKDKTFS